jgi:RHS repeat-associated protein
LIDGNNQTGYAQVLEQLNAPGSAPTVSYMIGQEVLGQCGSNPDDTLRWFLHDGHGSTRQLTDINTTVSSHYGYEGYGLMAGGSSSSPETSMLYSGEQYDSTLGMYNLRARFYDPSNGRFNAMDSFGGYNEDPQSLHKYVYANCDPVNGRDPSGAFTALEIVVFISVIAIIGIAI